jgi:hypothetical protein
MLLMIYTIKIQGILDKTWSDWLGNVEIQTEQAENGNKITLLSVDLIDQAALFGILDYLRDLNLILISVNQQNEK